MRIFFLFLLWFVHVYIVAGYKKDPVIQNCVHGIVIGQGCLTNSYAIQLDKKNRDYGIRENLAYDNIVETLNLPEQFKSIGTHVYFIFDIPAEEPGKYLTYCTPAPQVTIVEVSQSTCPIAVHTPR